MENLENSGLKEQFQAFLDIVVDPAAVVADDGEFILWNKQFLKLLDVETLKGRTYIEFTHKEDLELDRGLHQECINGDRDNYIVRKRYITPEGKIVFVRLTVKYVRGKNGISYSISTTNDITIETEAEKIASERTRLLDAIERKEFILHYQPIIAMRDFPLFSTLKDEVFAHEALVRWASQDSLVYPDKFLPKLRLLGMEPNLCELVLDMGIKKIAAVNKRICLNIEPLTLSLDEFNKKLFSKLNKYGVKNTSLLILEIVESESLDDTLEEKLKLLSKNFLISLDDWGSRYNNLVRVGTLPVHLVKLDKSLLKNAIVTERAISLIHDLGLLVIAEGIETKEQADWLESLGCDFGQGYYYGFPQAEI
jgi:PAS domain S-box-containing protein